MYIYEFMGEYEQINIFMWVFLYIKFDNYVLEFL